MLDARRVLREARVALSEAQVEIPDEWMAAFKGVMTSAARVGRLPKQAPTWAVDKSPRTRRASDRPKTAEPSKSLSVARPDSVTSKRTGRVIPGTNRFLQGGRSTAAVDLPPPDPDDFKDEPTDVNVDQVPDEFPDLPAPASAAVDVGSANDDRVLSRAFIDGPPEDGKIDVPAAGLPIGMHILKPGQSKQRNPGSISRLFQRRSSGQDGRRELDKTMRKMDRDAQRAAKRGPRGQGTLSRLIKGKDVTR